MLDWRGMIPWELFGWVVVENASDSFTHTTCFEMLYIRRQVWRIVLRNIVWGMEWKSILGIMKQVSMSTCLEKQCSFKSSFKSKTIVSRFVIHHLWYVIYGLWTVSTITDVVFLNAYELIVVYCPWIGNYSERGLYNFNSLHTLTILWIYANHWCVLTCTWHTMLNEWHTFFPSIRKYP